MREKERGHIVVVVNHWIVFYEGRRRRRGRLTYQLDLVVVVVVILLIYLYLSIYIRVVSLVS